MGVNVEGWFYNCNYTRARYIDKGTRAYIYITIKQLNW